MPKQSFHQAAPARQPVSKQPIREQDDLGEPQPIGKATYDYQASYEKSWHRVAMSLSVAFETPLGR